jgi:hypothetical protein
MAKMCLEASVLQRSSLPLCLMKRLFVSFGLLLTILYLNTKKGDNLLELLNEKEIWYNGVQWRKAICSSHTFWSAGKPGRQVRALVCARL